MQPTKSDQEDAFAEEVERYRAGGRQEKKYIPDSSVQQAAHLAEKVGEFDPMAFLNDVPQQAQIKNPADNLDAELNPFFSPTNRKPKDLTASPDTAGSGNVRGGW